jgi:hypothetical protein
MPDEPTDRNKLVLELLARQGDALTHVREIDHFAFFPTTALRTQFIDKCLAAGFKLRGTSEPDKPDTSFGANLFHADAPNKETIGKVTSLLTGLAQQCGGEYDGWEMQLVK